MNEVSLMRDCTQKNCWTHQHRGIGAPGLTRGGQSWTDSQRGALCMGSGASREEAILRKKNASTTERNDRLKRAVLESREPGRHTAAEHDSMHAWERLNQLSTVMAEKAMARDQARRALQEEEARQRLQKAEERGRMLQDGTSCGLDPRHEKASEAQNDEVESRKRVKQEHSRRKERIVNQVRTDVQALLEFEFGECLP